MGRFGKGEGVDEGGGARAQGEGQEQEGEGEQEEGTSSVIRHPGGSGGPPRPLVRGGKACLRAGLTLPGGGR